MFQKFRFICIGWGKRSEPQHYGSSSLLPLYLALDSRFRGNDGALGFAALTPTYAAMRLFRKWEKGKQETNIHEKS
jgi:hypothetical protein